MRWDDFRRSDNIEDRRDDDGTAGPGGFSIPGGPGGLGIGTIVVLGLIGWALGIDPSLLISGADILTNDRPTIQAPTRTTQRTGTPTDAPGQFVAAVLGETEDRWKEIFQKENQRYRAPTLVLFRRTTDAQACGFASVAMGPFYCPRDQKIYLDTSFFRDLQVRFRGCDAGSRSCEFAQAYVIAHEVGHHVQNQLGILSKVEQTKRGLDTRGANQLQVRVELQADCFAGVWAHHSNQKWKSIEPGDVEAAMQTAAAIGDDRLQQRARGHVVPDSFTHGSSAQRVRWFTTGLKAGTVTSCNTFAAAQL